ncbi:MAG: hypothetical protein Q4D70_07000 [bacterium]|nr:hypothetical protein [bacterium]
MLRKKKMLTTALCAGGVVLSAVMAEDTTSEASTTADGTLVSQPFASELTDVTTLTGDKAGAWAGYGSVTNQSVGTGYAKSVGTPIAEATDKLYLSVDGYVTCTAATTENKPATVDMMIQIAKPDEKLDLPTGELPDKIQIAVGVDTDGSLKVYCKNRGGVTGWYTLDKTEYAEGEWHRVSFTFDYANQTCQIRLDGEPLMTADGYLTSDPKGASSDIGSWYKLNTTEAKNLSSVKVVGSTAIDEVVIKQADSGKVTDVLPALADAGSETDGVPNQWIAEQGITRAMAEGDAPDGTGMKVVEKYQAGFDVADGQKLEIKKMTMTTGGAQLVVPVAQARDGFKNVIEVNKGATVEAERVDIPVGEGTVTVPVPAPNGNTAVKYTYQIKTQTTK